MSPPKMIDGTGVNLALFLMRKCVRRDCACIGCIYKISHQLYQHKFGFIFLAARLSCPHILVQQDRMMHAYLTAH